MSFVTRINLALSVVFIIGLVVAGYISHAVLQRSAEREVITHAGMMMEAALAARGYTIDEVKPLLTDKLDEEFLPQTVPSYAATQTFNRLRERHPEYIYKEATLNPTNLRDRATDWETDIIQQFRNNDQLAEVIGQRPTPTGPSLYLARPIRIENAACLSCHSIPANAPETMTALYGTANGFGWHLNEVIGSQVVSVPLSVPLAQAEYTFRVFMISLVTIFGVIFIVMNVILHLVVVRPVRRITVIADQISRGNLHAPEFKSDGTDDISELGAAFNRMRRSLEKTLEMLER